MEGSARTPERKSMRTFVKAAASAAMLAVPAAAFMLAPQAHATAGQDAQFVACITAFGIVDNAGPSAAAAAGRMIAADIATGRTVAEEQSYVYRMTPSDVTQTAANELVNCAVEVWLGSSPNSAQIVL